jgi:hypothetical protein
MRWEEKRGDGSVFVFKVAFLGTLFKIKAILSIKKNQGPAFSRKSLILKVRPAGIEPATDGLEIRSSIQLS